MNKMSLLNTAMIILLTLTISCSNEKRPDYPITSKVDQVDDYFGTPVPDPYRWLEDDNSEETKAWVQAQVAVTSAYLEQLPYREKIRERLTAIWDFPKESAPFKEGGRYYIFRNDGLQNQDVVYMKETLDGKEEVILDPNAFSEDGTISLTDLSPSRDGRYLGYGISRGGSDWNEYKVLDLATREELPDHLLWIKFSGMAWYRDGFFYSRYEKPEEGTELSGENKNCRIYYHRIGNPQETDRMIFEEPAFPYRSFVAQVTEDEKYIIITAYESTHGNALYIKDLTDSEGVWEKLVDNFDNNYSLVNHVNGKLYVMTDFGAPKYRLMAIDMNNPARNNWSTVIPEKENVLTGISMIGGRLIANYMKDARSKVEIFDLEGAYLYDIELPILGSVSGFNGKWADTTTFYSLSSFTTPSIIYHYDVLRNTSAEYHRTPIDFDPDLYEARQVFYNSKDGTKIPMFIVHKKGLELNGTNPALLYGYGGFNVSLTPRFSITRLILLENGFVFALANIRGGGEYGEEWHQAGIKMKKQNVFDDFIAAAEYLIGQGYTSSGKLAIQGGSNGGLLVGAVVNQRPELFGAAIPEVGVMDMLRYHKFTIGKFWATDYGTSEDSKEMFGYLYDYSPLHTIRGDVEYPAIMVTTADHDDRVVPAHSFKYAATLQEKYRGSRPVLIRIETSAGHGAGTPTTKIINEYSDIWAFLMKNLDVAPIY
jgi:prolyl oligopeptidase